jgi:hypothetical protein
MKVTLLISSIGCSLILGLSHLSLGQEVEVTLKNSNIGPSVINVEFSNNSETTTHILKYNFCESGVLLDNLFKIQKNSGASKEDIGHYGGLVDFISGAPYPRKDYLEILPKTKLSCTVDISQYYAVYEHGIYNIIYKKQNPFIGSVKVVELTSNELNIELSPGLHKAESKSSKK